MRLGELGGRERLTVSHRLVPRDLRKEFVEGFVVFLETLLEEKNLNEQPEFPNKHECRLVSCILITH